MSMTEKMAAALLVCWVAIVPNAAGAAECTGSLAGLNGISISSTALAFGAYDPSNTTQTASTFTITAACNGLLGGTLPPLTIAISAGDSGSFSPRAMEGTGAAAGAMLEYQIYDSSSESTVWGDGTGGSATVSGGAGTSSSQTFTGYGMVPAGQYVTPGSYSDTLTITMTY